MSDEATKKPRARQTGIGLEADIIKKIDAQLGRLTSTAARMRIVHYVAKTVSEQSQHEAMAPTFHHGTPAPVYPPRQLELLPVPVPTAEDLFG